MIPATASSKKLQPATALALGADLGAPEEVAFRDNADQMAGGIKHGQPADMIAKHGLDGLSDRAVCADRDHLRRHDLVRAHGLVISMFRHSAT